MPTTPSYSFTRYLAAKKSVDDRALNQNVWQTLKRNIPACTPEKPLRVLEIGAGIGTMIERLLDWELINYADYTAIDESAENVQVALQRLPDWAGERGYQISPTEHGFTVEQSQKCITVQWRAVDLFDIIEQEKGVRQWDLLVAHAFLDLVDVPNTLPLLLQILSKGGLYYFTINFDGVTAFEPAIDPNLDEVIQTLYHQTMDQRLIRNRPSGDSHTGRHLFTHLARAGSQILDAGPSDWLVYPTGGKYPADEAYFLHFIIHTIHTALAAHPELNPDRFIEWVDQRHAQIERGELVYLAHQIDFVGAYPGDPEEYV